MSNEYCHGDLVSFPRDSSDIVSAFCGEIGKVEPLLPHRQALDRRLLQLN